MFVGDSIFMPDSGTARCDFPGGDAGLLYASIRRLYELPGETRVFVCHDYKPGGREASCETTIALLNHRARRPPTLPLAPSFNTSLLFVLDT